MKDFTLSSKGTFINLCNNNLEIDSIIHTYFMGKNFAVVPFLKETNSFVLIVSDYPVDKVKLFKLLDPYRIFCDTVLLLILNPQLGSQPLPSIEFVGYGITNILIVSNQSELIFELDKAFSRWFTINNLVNSESVKKKVKVDRFIKFPITAKKSVGQVLDNNLRSIENEENVFALFEYENW